MKTKLSFALVALALSNYVYAQIPVVDLGPHAQFGHISAIDFDGDGDLDLVVGGEETGTSNVQVFTNDGFGTYTPVSSNLYPLARPTFDWNDVNQDGTPDLLTNGFGPFAGIFTNDGSGALTVSAITLPQTAPACAFADLNNDGYIDVLVFGNDNTGVKSKILFNDKTGGFTESNQFDSYVFTDPQVSIIDYDNDKDLDLFITAGFETGVNTRFSMLFVNVNGVFTATPIAGLNPKGNGSSTWGDYNGDGFADLLLNGDGYLGSGEDADNYRLYKNNGDGTFITGQAFGYRQNMTGGGGAFLDWDNDGDLDVVVTGWTGSRQATDVYLNDGTGNFTAYADNSSIPGSSEGSVEVGDANNDGQLDLFISGFSGNDWGMGAFNRNVALVALNPNNNPNTAPTAPTNLVVSGNSAQLNFSWTAGTDPTTAQASLTYNFYLKDANNKWYYTPLSDISTGKTKTAKIGNVQYNTSWMVKGLPAGTYTWGVQAVDNSFVGSTFASGTFTVNTNGTLPITIGAYSAFADGNSAVIKWQSLTETNTNKFVIERSIDGQNFNTVSTVLAKGNSSTTENYLVRDKNPANGTNYYRLTSIDNDGSTQVFDVMAVDFKIVTASNITIYPNPVTSSTIGVKFQGFDGKMLTATLLDVFGHQVISEKLSSAGDGQYSIHLPQKPAPGVYYLKIGDNSDVKTIKVLVQ